MLDSSPSPRPNPARISVLLTAIANTSPSCASPACVGFGGSLPFKAPPCGVTYRSPLTAANAIDYRLLRSCLVSRAKAGRPLFHLRVRSRDWTRAAQPRYHGWEELILLQGEFVCNHRRLASLTRCSRNKGELHVHISPAD